MQSKVKATVLLVDDDPVWSDFMVFIIKEMNMPFDVITASDGVQALEKIAENAVDLVVTDTNMPNMNGVEFLKVARQSYADLPIVVLFGGLMGSDIKREDILALGATAVFGKDEIAQSGLLQLWKLAGLAQPLSQRIHI